MRKALFSFLAAAALSVASGMAQQAADTVYRFTHGPYLQGLTAQGVKVYFTTSARGVSAVEVRKKGSAEVRRVVDYVDGLVQANNTRNAIPVGGLEPNTLYEYRLSSVPIRSFRLSNNVYGDTITTPWYTFRTDNPAATSCSFVTLSDMHDNAAKYGRLLDRMPVGETDRVFLLGDMLSNFSRPDQPYPSYIDTSVTRFARSIPFVAVRGNHETRGRYARLYGNYVYRPRGKFYGTYRLGDTFIIVLDTGEDKPDTHIDYSRITAFDAYRQEQVAWLRRVVRSEAFRQARHRIVLLHIPPVRRGENRRASAHGPAMVDSLYMPILNREPIDLMIGGHLHEFVYRAPRDGENNFPILLNDNACATLVSVDPAAVSVRTVNQEGKVIFEKKFSK